MSRLRLVGAVLAVFLAISACGGSHTVGTNPSAENVVLRIVAGAEVVAEWTLADLESEVGFIAAIVDGDQQKGARLLDVIGASGVEDWGTAEVFGFSEGRTFEVQLAVAASEVDHGWILDVTKGGTSKLEADDLPREEWVRDVVQITVPRDHRGRYR